MITALTLSDFEEAARNAVDPATWAYVAGGAGSDRTVQGNIAALAELWLRPRILGSSGAVPKTDVTVLGQKLSLPVLLAPTSPQRLLHDQAELATARASSAVGTVCVVSTDTHYPFPEIADAAGKMCWFQLYPYRSRKDIERTIAMAADAGATALVVTVDANFPARRITASRAGFRAPGGLDFGTLRALGILNGDVPANARLDRLPLNWDDLASIRRQTSLPLLIKGVLHPSDARRCVELGANGIIVSNHGGRQLDSAVPSIIALQQVVDAVAGQCEILVDGGIRSGVDVVKALAMGARAVCIGRPYLWGLTVAGEEGVKDVLLLLQREVEDTLQQLGLAGVSEVDKDCLAEVRWACDHWNHH